MGSNPHLRWLSALVELDQARRRASRTAFLRRSVREPLALLMLWTLTATLGLILSLVAVSGLAGRPHGWWHDRTEIWRETRPRQFERTYDEQHRVVFLPAKEVWRTLFIPSPLACGLAAIGLVASLTGFSRRRISALALLSAVLLLASVSGPLLFVLAAQSYFLVLDALT